MQVFLSNPTNISVKNATAEIVWAPSIPVPVSREAIVVTKKNVAVSW